MSGKLRVVQCGLGPIGIGVTRELLTRNAIEIVGAIDVDPKLTGIDLAVHAGEKSPCGIKIERDVHALLGRVKADVALVTTSSAAPTVAEHMVPFLERGVHVVSSCEELAYAKRTHPEVCSRLDAVAKKGGVACLSTGVNPGYLMDFLPLVATGVAKRVDALFIERIQDASSRRLPFQQKIGAGLTPAEFDAKVKAGTLRHVGLTESMHMIADALGWPLDRAEETIAPVLAEKPWKWGKDECPAGRARGVEQFGRAWSGGKEVLTLHFRATIGEIDPRDSVRIVGDPPISFVVPGGTNGDTATIAILVNAVHAVLRAAPGLRTMADVPLIVRRQS